MHIVFLTGEYPLHNKIHGGIGSFVQTIAKGLIKENIAVTVIGFHSTVHSVDDDEGVRVISLSPSKAPGLKWYFNFRKLNKEIRKLHSQSPISIVESPELLLAFINKIPGIKYLIRLHGGHHFFSVGENRKVNNWKGFQEKRSFSKADGFIAVSNHVKEETQKFLSYGNKPIEIINYPISIERFYPSDPVKVVKNSLVFAGTICEKKGVRQLLQALKLLHKDFPDLHLNLFGRDWKFPGGKSYTDLMKESFADIKDSFTFYGPVEQARLPSIYEEAEICIFPSHSETQGLVAPESMAMEKPVIFTQLGPGSETITHGIDGWLCNPLDPIDIAGTIKMALSQRDDFSEIGRRARAKVIGKFSPKKILKANIDFYTSICDLK
ncbi:glycosyltransferase family 4 protein [Algoriphagus sp. NG3]|uniref:glycosyltransferase family 4 protein n=1 Tax=Algoriphagus sp. NG3 TaxID=3097546 RepID=UPI002A8044D2|nr:glycosyltransferase family 4 protein [Algoriphagus sp. NG3]WPR77810.1 glycosyltransferase family 4 protein [Algoriphagus sp. NG3]